MIGMDILEEGPCSASLALATRSDAAPPAASGLSHPHPVRPRLYRRAQNSQHTSKHRLLLPDLHGLWLPCFRNICLRVPGARVSGVDCAV